MPGGGVVSGAFRAVEYGVIVDRTTDGLGYFLAACFASRAQAERRAAELRRSGDGYPAVVKERTVLRSEWLDPEPCPTCTGPTRETVGMVCQTCGTDYSADGAS